MNYFDLIGIISRYATEKGYYFLSGDNFYQNYEASKESFDKEQLILSADFNAVPIFNIGSKINQVNYTGALAIGRKFDSNGTPANLDETFLQKYTTRLLELSTILATIISEICCQNELQATGVAFNLELNKFDENIDFVGAQITFIQYS